MDSSIRGQYAQHGVDDYYKHHGNDYSNPHESVIREHLQFRFKAGEFPTSVLDLCCGGGEVSKFLLELKYDNVTGCDPYTNELYTENTNLPCLPYDFKHLATEGLDSQYDMIICSFALHLCPESMLPSVLYNLSMVCNHLLIISPNKKPTVDSSFEFVGEVRHNRVTSRLYRSQFASNTTQ